MRPPHARWKRLEHGTYGLWCGVIVGVALCALWIGLGHAVADSIELGFACGVSGGFGCGARRLRQERERNGAAPRLVGE